MSKHDILGVTVMALLAAVVLALCGAPPVFPDSDYPVTPVMMP